ncbi:MAG: hypothetical protein OXC19_22570 [Bryobacterales bacterium]|nr:hypothetical protein [Bryobacterales bacterium]
MAVISRPVLAIPAARWKAGRENDYDRVAEWPDYVLSGVTRASAFRALGQPAYR